MPHIHIDYSPNLEDYIDLPALCSRVRDVALETGAFPLAGIRVRAIACDHYVTADGDDQHAYLDMSVRLRGGRPDEVKEKATEQFFNALHDFCREAMTKHSISLSMEMRDIDPRFSPKVGSIRDFLPEEV